MSVFDVRANKETPIDTILFGSGRCGHHAEKLTTLNGSVEVVAADVEDYGSMTIGTEQDAVNLILALQKALELKWWKA